MTIDDCLDILNDSARNVGLTDEGNDTYSLPSKYRAIRGVLNHFIRQTQCTRESSSVSISAQNSSVDFSGITGFEPQRLIDDGIALLSTPWATVTISGGTVTAIAVNASELYTTAPTVTFSSNTGTGAAATANLTNGLVTSYTITNAGSGYLTAPTLGLNNSTVNYTAQEIRNGIAVVNADEFRRRRSRHGMDLSLSCGVPDALAFTSGNSASIDRPPRASGTLTVLWSPPLPTFDPTDGDAGSGVTINVSDDYAEAAIRSGGVAWLQYGQIEHLAMTNPLKQEYLALINSCRGMGNLGVRSHVRRRKHLRGSFNPYLNWAATEGQTPSGE